MHIQDSSQVHNSLLDLSSLTLTQSGDVSENVVVAIVLMTFVSSDSESIERNVQVLHVDTTFTSGKNRRPNLPKMSGNCRWELHSSIPQNSSPSAYNGPGMGQHGNHGRGLPCLDKFHSSCGGLKFTQLPQGV